MDLPETITYTARHAIEWISVGLLVAVTLLLLFHYIANRRRYS